MSNKLLVYGGIVGIILSIIGLILNALYPPQLDFINPPEAAAHTSASAPDHIAIPDLNINLAIEPGIIQGTRWSVSNTNANHLAISANPGDAGNIIIYGHNSRSIFGRLTKAHLGQTISITNKQGQLFQYRIQEIVTVTPDNGSVIAPTDTEILTVYTCTGFANSRRLVIKAVPL